MATTTTANQVAEVLGDGQRWRWSQEEVEGVAFVRQVAMHEDGYSLDDVCHGAGSHAALVEGDATIWTFPDGSAIVAGGGGWDERAEECEAHCWAGAGCDCPKEAVPKLAKALEKIKKRADKDHRKITARRLAAALRLATQHGEGVLPMHTAMTTIAEVRKSQADYGYRPSLYYCDRHAHEGEQGDLALACAIVLEAAGVQHWQA